MARARINPNDFIKCQNLNSGNEMWIKISSIDAVHDHSGVEEDSVSLIVNGEWVYIYGTLKKFRDLFKQVGRT